ncbi:potassium-transporting ATPase subunit KdpC [Lichenifustis flavocetrariae]|uniref:Potassium-transporting ATPase KdpC subunit n=1 Tax=Lichenifustis flavocetrariae TaxID=2949735 RepID=A0AA42CN20_9HYPH|nr:potassium-transporting ATPase subunit KdpC [Lichenifustis flavocetrariae]MCW6512226.1 potassium-transporting ATPase subunit KdpC [Lichenifustis flavocetrariae]
MLSQLRPAIAMIVLFTALTGIAYPLAITGIAQVAMKGPADGSMITRNGTVVGSALIGENFATDRFFQGRPSATSAPDPKDATKTVDAPYNAANSSGSNLGPTSQKLVDRVKASVAALGGSPAKSVAADAVTTSASGLDPDISPAYAAMQIGRVASARKLDAAKIQALVANNTVGSALFGNSRVQVLQLNVALEDLDPTPAAAAPAASSTTKPADNANAAAAPAAQ